MTAKSVATRLGLSACALGLLVCLGVPDANAATYNFSSPPGFLGTTENYTASGVTITAAGFTNNTFSTPTFLWGKNDGGNENGLGLLNDPSGDNEISGSNLVRLSLSNLATAGLTSLSFQMNSTTDGEGWQVFGSNNATSTYALIASGTDQLSHSLAQFFPFLYFRATAPGDNVLLASLTAVTPVPLPPALLLFAGGLAAVGFLGRYRKQPSQPEPA
jgi:hypothetical protein